jgi:hypothetical protein
MVSMVFRALGVWFLFVPAAILNGALRDKVLIVVLGQALALPLSGIILSILIFFITMIFVPYLGGSAAWHFWLTGFMWLILTVAFEFVFGHCVMGKTWVEIVQIFNVAQGNLMIVVVIATLISPFFAARFRGLIS